MFDRSGTAAAGHLLRQHGGRLSHARSLHPNAPEPWIDLSTGINPTPYPVTAASDSARARLPDPEQLKALEATAGEAFGVRHSDRILATAGSEAALRAIPYVLRSSAAFIVGPTYSSHADAWRRSGAQVSLIPHANDASSGSTVTLVNPNNPDGAVIARERVLELHDRLRENGGYLVVDEAFADVEPACSVADVAGTSRFPGLLVFRSFGKFYGLAGVRLGFVVAAPAIVARFRDLFGDWPISADAIHAGLTAYADVTWADRMRTRLQLTAQRLDDRLTSAGFEIVGGTSLYRLARSAIARARFERLLQAGILVRPFDHDPTLLRFGLPQGEAAWERLDHALRTP
jgi:cobalamin biosynthetic protein CobC